MVLCVSWGQLKYASPKGKSSCSRATLSCMQIRVIIFVTRREKCSFSIQVSIFEGNATSLNTGQDGV